MKKNIYLILAIVIVDLIIVAYCFPITHLGVDLLAQISLIVFATSTFTVTLLNSIYHVFCVDKKDSK